MDIKPGKLRSHSEMMQDANVSDRDIEKAKQEWQDNPPDDKYREILEAEIEDE